MPKKFSVATDIDNINYFRSYISVWKTGAAEGLSSKLKYRANLLKYILCTIILFPFSSRCRQDQFAILHLTLHILLLSRVILV